jgi:hypothetical protein
MQVYLLLVNYSNINPRDKPAYLAINFQWFFVKAETVSKAWLSKIQHNS